MKNHLEIILQNWWLLALQHRIPPELQMKEGAGQGSPFESAICEKADLDSAISSLAPKGKDIWHTICINADYDEIKENYHRLSKWQRYVVGHYILQLDDSYCPAWILPKMAKFLRGEDV